MGKLGRKVCCNFKKDVKCLGLVNGEKLCYVDMTTEEKYNEAHQFHWVFCPLFPEVKKVELMAALKSEGFSIAKRWVE